MKNPKVSAVACPEVLLCRPTDLLHPHRAEGEASKKLSQDAAQTPHINRHAISRTQDYFRRPIEPRLYVCVDPLIGVAARSKVDHLERKGVYNCLQHAVWGWKYYIRCITYFIKGKVINHEICAYSLAWNGLDKYTIQYWNTNHASIPESPPYAAHQKMIFAMGTVQPRSMWAITRILALLS